MKYLNLSMSCRTFSILISLQCYRKKITQSILGVEKETKLRKTSPNRKNIIGVRELLNQQMKASIPATREFCMLWEVN